jgi:FAD/FMN-containing dehydrogenase
MKRLVGTRLVPLAASPDVLVFPGGVGWDAARRASNLAADQRPAAVALPRSVDDVIAAVDYARTVGLRVAVQGPGHGTGADGPLDGTLLVETARMTGGLDARMFARDGIFAAHPSS